MYAGSPSGLSSLRFVQQRLAFQVIEIVGLSFAYESEAHFTYQTPLSLPVIFCPTRAAVAGHGRRLKRALL